uniref:ER membrane protein complex subunit 6 n=1 Tax=Chenopodium quinoa TaxID=63459 RepID=A0A803MNC8_CHEQI
MSADATSSVYSQNLKGDLNAPYINAENVQSNMKVIYYRSLLLAFRISQRKVGAPRLLGVRLECGGSRPVGVANRSKRPSSLVELFASTSSIFFLLASNKVEKCSDMAAFTCSDMVFRASAMAAFTTSATLRGTLAIDRTFMSIVGGIIAGILGFTGLTGFIFYFLVMAVTSVGLTAKAKFSIHTYFDSWNRILLDGFLGGLMVLFSFVY